MNRRIFAATMLGMAMWPASSWAAGDAGARPDETPAIIAIETLPVGSVGTDELLRQIDRWRDAGLLTRATRLQARAQQKSEPAFAALAILEFRDEAAWRRWSGAPRDAALRVRRVDAFVRGGVAAWDPRPATFEVNSYRLLVTPARYREFCEGYIVPLMEGQVEAGLMRAYTMYVERPATDGERPYAWLVKAYRDDAVYAGVPGPKLALRERLTATHPTYPAFHAIKDTLREDLLQTTARWR